MKIVKIDPNTIDGWGAFQEVFPKAFDFPRYYGGNMNAWIDCMDEFNNELTLIDLGDCRVLKEKIPEIVRAMQECSAIVNYRRMRAGEAPVLVISMWV